MEDIKRCKKYFVVPLAIAKKSCYTMTHFSWKLFEDDLRKL